MKAWRPISQKPPRSQAVLVVHRVRRYCRYHDVVVGWWNGEEWMKEDSDYRFKSIYKPVGWLPIDLPDDDIKYSWKFNAKEFQTPTTP